MFVRMREGLIQLYEQVNPTCMDAEIAGFLASIEGQIIEVVFIGQDAFEKENNNIWLPNELWEKL